MAKTIETLIGDLTLSEIKTLKKLYSTAIKEEKSILIFKEGELFVPFVKYLLEFVRPQEEAWDKLTKTT